MIDPVTGPAAGTAATTRQQLGALLASLEGRSSATVVTSASAEADHVGAADVEDETVRRALAFVLRSTKARPQTVAEQRAKLAARDYEDRVIDAAVARATALGALDDAAFARAWVADRGMTRGYSAVRLRRELRRRQVPERIVDDVLTRLADRDDLAVATELARTRAQRMPAELDPEVVARRLVGFLARRGYSEALARRVAIEVTGLDRRWD